LSITKYIFFSIRDSDRTCMILARPPYQEAEDAPSS
jgi:hypothetical protein